MPTGTLKILVAPDSFKDCLPSAEVARSIGKGISNSDSSAAVTLFPVADGGEGASEIIKFHCGGTWKEMVVNDPLHRPVRSGYLVIEDGKTAVIELAGASGLEMLAFHERNALKTSTLGTGELIKDALGNGLRKIILTIGGSATVDGGTGIAHALGFRFFDIDDRELIPSGEMTVNIHRIDNSNVHPGLTDAEIVIACDVQNILNGSEGAARVYGPQKGADERAVKILEEGLMHLSSLIYGQTGFMADDHPGTGAAGGAALFLLSYARGVLKPGFEIISELTGFEDAVRRADLIISGEGRIDRQTTYGKLVASVASIARNNMKPFVAVAGVIEGDREGLKKDIGAIELYSLSDLASGNEDSIKNASEYLEETGRLIMKQFKTL